MTIRRASFREASPSRALSIRLAKKCPIDEIDRMALPDLFSRRLKRQNNESVIDVYIYDKLPNRLRIQITHIWDEAFGLPSKYNEHGHYVINELVRAMRKELGIYSLNNDTFEDERVELYNWFLREPDISNCLDLVELAYRMIDKYVRDNYGHFYPYVRSNQDSAIAELNARFLEAGVGFQFEAGALVRVDTQLLHAEVVKPAIALLQERAYASANIEFMEAHKLYRSGDFEKCLTECCKAFESVLKIIISKRNWHVAPNATAKPLLDTVFENGLIVEYAQGGFNSIRALLEGSIATLRNKSGGHGAGTTQRSVSRHMAAYQLHQTAAAILFLIEAEKALP